MLAVAVALAAACAWPGTPTEPIDPDPDSVGEDPCIDECTWWIYLADADGSIRVRLAAGDLPAWSPKGDRIAFERDSSVYVIGIDGSGERLLRTGRQPSWSPDGEHLAFTNDSGIAVMRGDGTGVTLLQRHGFRTDTWAPTDMGIGKPAWSPDGSRIAFEHLGDGELTPAQIFMMNADGSRTLRVTPTRGIQYAESDPSWFPDGQSILFWSYGFGIARATLSGGVTGLYLDFPAIAYGAKPVVSPDGQTILLNGFPRDQAGGIIWKLQVSTLKASVFLQRAANAAWAPDGRRIALVRPGSRAGAARGASAGSSTAIAR
jgi:Tol biopolymer transport system component